MEFYHTAREIREDITNLLLRDFGVKDKIRSEIIDGNRKLTIIEEYPEWLIAYFRENILKILNNLISNVTAGNTIYPINEEELITRRQYQTESVINCEQLLQEIQFCADVLPVKLDKFMPFIERIDKEIALLKGWRKSSNKLRTSNKVRKGGVRER
jgi:hypothetical protein